MAKKYKLKFTLENGSTISTTNLITIPDDSDLVHKTGTETIAGAKTFNTQGSINTNVTISGGYGGQSGYESDAIGGLMLTGAASGLYGKATLLLAHADSSSSTSSPVKVYLPNKTGTLATIKYEHNIILTLSQGNGTTGKLCCSFRFIDDNSSAYTTHANLVTAMFNAGYDSSSHYITASGEYSVPGSTYTPGYKYSVIGLYYTSASDAYPGIKAILTGTYNAGEWTINDTTASYSSISVYGGTTPTIVDNVREL